MHIKVHTIAVAIALASITAFADLALAQSSKAWRQCGEISPDIVIRGCTAVIKAGKDAKKNLAGAYLNRGGAYSFKGQYDRAIEDFDQAIRLNPNYAEAYYNRGAAYNYKGQYDRAIQDFHRAIKLNPSYAGAFGDRCGAYIEKGQHERAIQDCDRAIKLDPKFALAFQNRGAAYKAKGHMDRAIRDFSEAIKLDPEVAQSWSTRCLARALVGQLDEALKDCDESLRLAPDDAEALDSRALVHLRRADFNKAIADYDVALKINPKKAASLYARGIAKQRTGDATGAEADMAAARAIDATIAETFGGSLDVASTTSSPESCAGIDVSVAGSQRCIAPGSGKSVWFKDCEVCPEMVVVPAGEFLMGSSDADLAALNPKHVAMEIKGLQTHGTAEAKNKIAQYGSRLSIISRTHEQPHIRVKFAAPFAVGRFSVTVDEWKACLADGGCNNYKPWEACDSYSDKTCGNYRLKLTYLTGMHPVSAITWQQAKDYLSWLSRKTGKTYRLLSESEREYVTRAGTTTAYWWGNTISPDLANYDDSGQSVRFYKKTGRSVPVDRYKPNPWGLYNVHGNVDEWVEDRWHTSHDGNTGDGNARTIGYHHSPFGILTVLRGGNFYGGPLTLRSAHRSSWGEEGSASEWGFRVARTLVP